MEFKKIYKIEDKQRLQQLYASQFTASFIRAEINDIIRACRNIPLTEKVRTKRITFKETLLFIKQNGSPIGYELSEEIKIKIQEV